MAEITSFVDASRVVYRGSQTQKSWAITHENNQKCEITSFVDGLELCTRGHKASKAPRDTTIMGFNPRKWPEMAEITSFSDDARVVYRGSQDIETLPG